MNDYHRENMRKHIAYLRQGAKLLQAAFDMSMYEEKSDGTNCGTVGCSLGHVPYSTGILKMTTEDWPTEYSVRVFGFALYAERTVNRDWQYCFNGGWQDINNTPEAAAARMEAVLYNQMPEYWDYKQEFAHPIVIVPEEEEEEEEAKKLFVTV